MDNKRFVVSDGRAAVVRDVYSGSVICRLTGHVEEITSLAKLDDDQFLSSSADGTVRLWSIQAKCCVATYSSSKMNFTVRVTVKEGATRFFFNTAKKRIAIYDMISGKCVDVGGYVGSMSAFCVSSDGDSVNVSTEKGVRVYHMSEPTHPQYNCAKKAVHIPNTKHKFAKSIYSRKIISISPTRIAAVTDNGVTIVDLDRTRGSIQLCIRGHSDVSICVEDNRMVTVCGQCVYVWDLVDFTCLYEIVVTNDDMYGCHPKARWITGGGVLVFHGDKSVSVWE